MRHIALALLLAGCGDDLLPGYQISKPPHESAENFCTEQANVHQELDQSCAPCPSNWAEVYQACLARFVGVATPGDAGARD